MIAEPGISVTDFHLRVRLLLLLLPLFQLVLLFFFMCVSGTGHYLQALHEISELMQ
jgi:hypothetical protein